MAATDPDYKLLMRDRRHSNRERRDPLRCVDPGSLHWPFLGQQSPPDQAFSTSSYWRTSHPLNALSSVRSLFNKLTCTQVIRMKETLTAAELNRVIIVEWRSKHQSLPTSPYQWLVWHTTCCVVRCMRLFSCVREVKSWAGCRVVHLLCGVAGGGG